MRDYAAQLNSAAGAEWLTHDSALVKAVNAERIAGFPNGRLFLDSIEQAIAAALVDAFEGQNRSVR